MWPGKISQSVAENLACSSDAVLAHAREKYVVIFGSHCCSTWQEVDDPKICGRQLPLLWLQIAVVISIFGIGRLIFQLI
jgi:hypothetical protein